MSNLSAFLHPAALHEEKEVVISNRFIGEDGKPVPFKIRSLSQEENAELSRKSTRRERLKGGKAQDIFNGDEYTARLVVAATVEPDFTAKELGEAYGVIDPIKVPGKMLRLGEYKALVEAILMLSGMANDEGTGDEEREEAKN